MKTFFGILGYLGLAVGIHAAPVNVVATTGMVADLVRNVGGDRVAVTALIGEGVDPHLFKPTRDDVAKLLKADVVFYNGLHLEGKLEDIFKKVAERGSRVEAISSGIDPSRLISENGHPDPHIWMDPVLWAECIPVVQTVLTEKDPEGRETFATRATNYREELLALDAYAKKSISSIPEEQRVLITAHDAFHYLARATGLTVLGVQGISTESEAGVADINRLVDEVVKRKIPAVFVESSVPDKNVRAVMEGAAARGHTLRLGGELFSDAMGATGTYEGTYIGMIDHNITTMTRALGGNAPERGMADRLSP